MYLKTQVLKVSDRAKNSTSENPGVLWLQGEASCSLAVIAVTLEHVLARQGYAVTLLDHDQINSGLCRDLSQSDEHRLEYARRVAEASKLFAESRILTIVMVDSLSVSEEECVRGILRDVQFSNVYVHIPPGDFAVEEGARETQCLFETATRPFVAPRNPELHLNTANVRSEDTINALLEHLDQRGSLPNGFSALAKVRKPTAPEVFNESPISIAAG